MPGWALKAGATGLTVLAVLTSAAFVSSHAKPSAAPLHPRVAGAASVAKPGKLTLTPSVRSADVKAVTSTYAS